MSNDKLSVALFGFGCVGQGLYDVLNHSEVFQADIARICVKDPAKERRVAASLITFDKEDILNRNDIDVVVEMITDTEEAYRIVSRALGSGVNVVSASKKMLATYFSELHELQEKNGTALIYEGSAGGSIPIIRTLEEYYDNELLSSIRGILNGTTNYILTRMELEGRDYGEVLKDAQQNGFAEADPWSDVAGYDTLYKTLLLSIHAFGIVLKPDEVLNLGIQNISFADIRYAREKGLRIRLIGFAAKAGDKFRIYVLPHFVKPDDELYKVQYEYNGIEVEGAYSCKQTFTGKGAGSHPTGSAVLSDISALTYNYKYAYKKLNKLRRQRHEQGQTGNDLSLLDKDFTLKVYIRFKSKDELARLDIRHVEEEYRSPEVNFIIAEVGFSSLYALRDDIGQNLFVCVVA
ncbi:MAG: homoserine dehydrogenase [Bacteroidia bacterium]|jgi:homoserine dehydrogenase|nr:homoserine dehydrogenase [Bacteroidia bacterium]